MNDDSRTRAFCPCCTGSGQVSDEHGDGGISYTCTYCQGTGLVYPVTGIRTFDPGQWATMIVVTIFVLVVLHIIWPSL